MKKVSRKGFLKIAAAAAMSGVTAGAISACESASSTAASSPSGAAVYTPGTYTAKATGMAEVTVTMTFTETSITEVTVDTSNETIDLARDSAADFQQALLDAQSAEIDTVAGATLPPTPSSRPPPTASARPWGSPPSSPPRPPRPRKW